MKKLLLAASALALVAAMSPATARSHRTAAAPPPAKSPFCNMAKGQKNLVAWNAYYHCIEPTRQQAQPAAARAPAGPPKDPMCKMAKGQKNLVSWNAYYHCLGPAPGGPQASAQYRRGPQASAQPRRLYAQAQLQDQKNPYCNMAKGQKNLVSWNAYYGCLNNR